MKRRKFITLIPVIFALLFGISLTGVEARASTYGIYGTVTYAGINPDSVVDKAVVRVYKSTGGGNWTYIGQTTASACGYYTFDTGGIGTFRAVVDGRYDLRTMPCQSVYDNERVGGDGQGTVSWVDPQVVVHVRTS
ncbi:MAG: hypothetical protein H8D63_02485 [Parcubacteria group bacterium]|nr:hypothetical protein [Parcubacteria group bacterium]